MSVSCISLLLFERVAILKRTGEWERVLVSVFCTRVVVDEGWKGEDIRKQTVIIG